MVILHFAVERDPENELGSEKQAAGLVSTEYPGFYRGFDSGVKRDTQDSSTILYVQAFRKSAGKIRTS